MRTTGEPHGDGGRPSAAAGTERPRQRLHSGGRIARLIVLCRSLPDRTKSSGELRFWQILDRLRRRSRSLVVFTEESGNRHLFPDLAVYPMAALEAHAPGADLAFLEFWFMGRYLPTLARHRIPAVLDSVDVEFLRRDREKALLGLDRGTYRREKAAEIRAYRAADQVWTVSKPDAARIREIARRIVVVPNIFRPPSRVPGFASRRGVSFVGSFSHQPNVDGLRWYRERVWPLVSDIPHAILGNGAPEDIRAMPGFVGGVERSTAHVSRARVSIAPLRYGAGLKGKVLEALACGTPVVTTSIGDEGYAARRRGAAVVADDPEAFARAIRRLVGSQAVWSRYSQRGRALAARYAPSVVGPVIDAALDAAVGASLRRR